MTQFNNSDAMYSNHLINQIHANLDLLLQQSKISHDNFNVIKGALPAMSNSVDLASREQSLPVRNDVGGSPSPRPPTGVHAQMQAPPPSFPVGPPNLTHEPPPSQFKQAKALWAYRGAAADDLSFEKGDTIVVLSEDNQDWWRGKVLNSQQPAGLFPSNHVEVISTGARSNSPARLAYPPHQTAGPYHVPPPQVHQGWQQAPGYNNQPLDMKAPPPPMQYAPTAPPPVNITVEKPKKKNMLQGRFGQALAGGAGFGAGSAVASHVVNAIL